MTQMKSLQPVTLSEFEAMKKEEGRNYELIDGIVMMSLRPSLAHQWISGKLFSELWHILKGTSCMPIQEIDLVLDEQNFIPDLMVICNKDIRERKHYDKPPMIAIEIISPTSASRDHILKRRKYEQLGVREYWIVSPEEKCIAVLSFSDGQEEVYCEGQVKSFVLPDIVINLDDIFD